MMRALPFIETYIKQELEDLMSQDPFQAGLISVQHRFEEPFAPFVKTAMLFFGFGTEQPGAHHGRERQRNDGREGDGHAQRNRELAEEPPDNASHENQWDENSNKRHGQ